MIIKGGKGEGRKDGRREQEKVEELEGQERTGKDRVEQMFFSKEHNILAFFLVLYKRMYHSLRSFKFFIKECGVLCVPLRSL